MMNVENKISKAVLLAAIVFLCILLLTGTGCGKKGEPIEFEMDGQQMLYKGSKQGDLAHGQGSLYLGSQLIYEGDFVDGWIEGQGKLYANGKVRYEGQFVDGEALGEGTIFNKAGKKMFTGEITENNGDSYKGFGYLYNSKGEAVYHGEITVQGHDVEVANKGQLLYPTGQVFYDGELKDGLPHGKGTYYDLEGNMITE